MKLCKLLAVFCFTICSLTPLVGGTKWESFKEKAAATSTFMHDHATLLKIVGCLLEVPAIAAADSQDATMIDLATASSMAVTQCKFLCDLLKQRETSLLKAALYDLPKLCAYGGAGVYDILRFKEPVPTFEKDDERLNRLRSFKISQSVLLTLEVVMRVLAFVDSYTDSSTKGRVDTASYLEELADWVEIWRLLSRYQALKDQVPDFEAKKKEFKDIILQSLAALGKEIEAIRKL